MPSSISMSVQQSPFEQAGRSFAAPTSGAEAAGWLPSPASQVQGEGSITFKPSGLETPFLTSNLAGLESEGES